MTDREIRETPRQSAPLSRTVFKYIVFSAFIFITAAFQSSFFSTAAIFPAVPDLLLTAVLGFALFDGEKSGAVAGIVAGVTAGALGADDAALLPLFYFAEGWIFGRLAARSLRKNIITWTLCVLAAAAARSGLSALYIVVTDTQATLPDVLFGILVPEFIMTAVFSYFNYLLTGLAVRPFTPRTQAAGDQDE